MWFFIACLDPKWELGWHFPKSTMESVETNDNMQILLGGGVCLSHHSTTTCMGITQSWLKEGKHACCKKT
jgi:hypothetical protein